MKKSYFAPDESIGRAILSIVAAIVIAIVCFGLFSFTLRSTTEAVFQKLGINQPDANQNISSSLLRGYSSHYGARNLKSIIAGDRASIVKDVVLYARQYTKGAEFKKDYEALRTKNQPQAPTNPETEAELRSKLVADLKKSIASTEESMVKMNDETKKMMAESLATLKTQLKEYENPNNELIKMMAQGAAQTYIYEQEEYKKKLAKWEKDYPANEQLFVKMRLQQFLNETKDIDFNAELKDNGRGKMKFVNPSYEAKSVDWKKAFRAGKEATETARQMVQVWLQEIA